jgi:hypothetical protein
MFKTRKIKGSIETPNVKSLSDKIDQLMADNEFFRQKQEEFDKKNRSLVQKLKDYWKGE